MIPACPGHSVATYVDRSDHSEDVVVEWSDGGAEDSIAKLGST